MLLTLWLLFFNFIFFALFGNDLSVLKCCVGRKLSSFWNRANFLFTHTCMPSQSVSLPRHLSWQQAITCLSLTPERIIPEMKVIILPQLGIQPTQLQQTHSQSKAPTHNQTVASGEQITLRLLISTWTRAITRHPMHPFLKRRVIFVLSLWRWH